MGSEKFCLRWNDFESNISSAFRELRDQRDFFDVTLSCDGEEELQAHRVILSACSPLFRRLLLRSPHHHPLIHLRGVRPADLTSVLTFIYQGEVSVEQDQLNSFLAVAEDLKVKGLTQGPGQPSEAAQTSQPAPPSAKQRRTDLPAPAPPTPGYSSVTRLQEEEEVQEVVTGRVKVEPGAGQQMVAAGEEYQDSYQEFPEEYGEEGGEGSQYYTDTDAAGVADFQEFISRVSEGPERGKFRCTLCGKVNGQKIHTQNHIENIHFPGCNQYNCKHCGMELPNRNKLYKHVFQMHK